MGTTSLEGVAKASEGSPLLIFQLYVQRDRDFTASLIQSESRPLVTAEVWDWSCTITVPKPLASEITMHSSARFFQT